VLEKRQPTLKLVIENIHDPHNVSAIFRTCDAAGIPKVKFKNVDECYNSLRKDGFKIYASQISDDAKEFFELDFTNRVAIVLGNEHRGISEEAAKLADERFLIPMYGMVQSLNVSVSAAITIYEALRQRKLKGMYDKPNYSSNEIEELIIKWGKK
jgi:tRNA (guanosine-2'-O-)-methyltransferase